MFCKIHVGRFVDVRVIDVFSAHGLEGQRVPQLQVAQRQEASQELSAEAGQQLRRILLHPAGKKIRNRIREKRKSGSGSLDLFLLLPGFVLLSHRIRHRGYEHPFIFFKMKKW